MSHTSLSVIQESLHNALVRVSMVGNQNMGTHTHSFRWFAVVSYTSLMSSSLFGTAKYLINDFYFEACGPEVSSLHNLEDLGLGHLSHLWVGNVGLFVPGGWPWMLKIDLHPIASHLLVATGESEVYQPGACVIIIPGSMN